MTESHPAPRSATEIAAAAQRLHAGELVVFPTETVYGIGASCRHPAAAARIFELKARPRTMPLMLHVAGAEAIDAFTRPSSGMQDSHTIARQLAEAFWPGPLTLILPAAQWLAPEILGGGDTVALRAPDHPLTRSLLAELGELEAQVPAIAGTSANRHGAPAPVDFAAASAAFSGQGPVVLDGGACSVGIASTIVRADAEQFELLRQGEIKADQIFKVCRRMPQVVSPPE